MACVVRDGFGMLLDEALIPNHNETVLDEALSTNHNETVLGRGYPVGVNHNETVLAG